jgi:hypothetical protein
MANTSRSLGFTNSLQRLVWQSQSGPNIPIIIRLYGGGGGGGGSDSGIGGSGGGGGYTQVGFDINNGDVIDIAVGGGGGGGGSGKAAGGGGAGASYVSGGTSYSGGGGGRSGPIGFSGAGGGGGGATVVLLNGHVMGVAGGGGGGGGAGNKGARNGQSAPGSSQAGPGQAGQNGQDKSEDGGGGGGGGGNGGNGGTVNPGDVGANAGHFGYSNNANPSGRTPGGSPPGQAGVGGGTAQPGNSGAAQIFFDIPGVFAHDGTSFKPVQRQWVNVNGVWREISEVYVRNGGSWNLVAGSLPAVFNKVSGSFGVASRPQDPEPAPELPPVDTGGGGDNNYPGNPNDGVNGTIGRGPNQNIFGGPPPGFVDRNLDGFDNWI